MLSVTIFSVAGNAMAAVDLTGVTLDTTTPETLAATVITGLGVNSYLLALEAANILIREQKD